MFLAFPFGYQTDHYVHKAVLNFGKLWLRPRHNKSIPPQSAGHLGGVCFLDWGDLGLFLCMSLMERTSYRTWLTMKMFPHC